MLHKHEKLICDGNFLTEQASILSYSCTNSIFLTINARLWTPKKRPKTENMRKSLSRKQFLCILPWSLCNNFHTFFSLSPFRYETKKPISQSQKACYFAYSFRFKMIMFQNFSLFLSLIVVVVDVVPRFVVTYNEISVWGLLKNSKPNNVAIITLHSLWIQFSFSLPYSFIRLYCFFDLYMGTTKTKYSHICSSLLIYNRYLFFFFMTL